MKKFRAVLSIFIALSIFGCSKVQVNPPLSTSLGYSAFENMETINVRDASVGLVFDQKLLNAKSQQNIKMGNFQFDLGKSFAVKLIKAVSHQFKEIRIYDKAEKPGDKNVDALMRVSLEDIDVSMDYNQGFSKVSTEGYTRLSVRAELKEVESNRVVWVGTSQVNHTGGIEEKILTYQEAGRGFAQGFDKAIDIAIGELLQQMQKSENLEKYFEKWENE